MKYFGAKISKIEQNMTNEKHKNAKKYKNITWAAAPAIRTIFFLNKKANKNVLLRHTVGQNWGKVQKTP